MSFKEKLVMEIGNGDSLVESLTLYRACYKIIPEYKFVFSSPKGSYPGFQFNKKFTHGASIRSLFNDENVLVLDPQTIEEMFSENGRATFKIDYSISLDNQALSYLQPYISGRKIDHGNDIYEIFEFLVQKNIQIDPTPYGIENIDNLDDVDNHPKIYDKLLGYEFIKSIDHERFKLTGELDAKTSKLELLINTDNHFNRLLSNSRDEGFREEIKDRYNQIYSYLLMMSIIQIRSPSRSIKNKMLDMLAFANDRAGFLSTRELILANEFFSRGTNFQFFSKIHKNSKKIWSSLNGMTWDLFHYRTLEQAITFDMGNDERYFFPGILTYDKGFIEVMEMTPLKAVAFKNEGSIPILFYNQDDVLKITSQISEVDDFYTELCSEKKIKERVAFRETLKYGLKSLVTELELELSSVSNVSYQSNLKS
nr:hypothetical protein [uncultured Erwinia sp.]